MSIPPSSPSRGLRPLLPLLLVLLLLSPSPALGACPSACTPDAANLDLSTTDTSPGASADKPTAACCAAYCSGYSLAFYVWHAEFDDPSAFRCECYSQCTDTTTGAAYKQVIGSTASCSPGSQAQAQTQASSSSAPATTDSDRKLEATPALGRRLSGPGPVCPSSCFDCYRADFALNLTDPVAQDLLLGLTPGVPDASTCAALCQAQGGHLWQYAYQDADRANKERYLRGDCACYSECPARYSSLSHSVFPFFQGALCNGVCSNPAPGTAQCPAYPVSVKSPCATVDLGNARTKYTCTVCNLGNRPASNIALSCDGFDPSAESCLGISPECTVAGVLRNGKCRTFQFQLTTGQVPPTFGPPVLNPFPVSSITIIPSTNVVLGPCTTAQYVSKLGNTWLPKVAIKYTCKLSNTMGGVTAGNVKLSCVNFEPLSLSRNFYGDCSISSRIGPGSFVSFSFITYPADIIMGLDTFANDD